MYSRIYLFIFILELFGCCQTVGAIASNSERRIAATPTPLSVPPSQFWDGNDGPWSSFVLRVGSPPQSVRVLISTSSNQPWIILPEGCSLCIPSGCPQKRGGIFYPNRSSTWSQNTLANNGVFLLPIDNNSGVRGTGTYGYDSVALSYLGSGVPVLDNQVVGGITIKEFHTGFFGINPVATNFSVGTGLVPSYMSSLKSEGFIPSLSYGYTAGNQYRLGKPLGSLTLGGFDSSLFEPSDLIIPFSSDPDFELSVNIKSITMTAGDTSQDLSSRSFTAVIDSTIPYLYLPLEVCQQFQEAFGIVYDQATGLYLVDDTLHDRLLQQSANIILTLTNSMEKVLVNITLPYQAFDLIAEYPLVTNTTRYFPLKRATNNSRITLGRTFFQEAYLIADYERRTFSLNQRKWNDNARENLEAITPQDNTTSLQKSSNKNNTVVIAIGATMGSVVLIAILIYLIILFRQRRSKIKIFLAEQSMRYRSNPPSPSPRPRISGPIVIPTTPEIEPPSTPVQTHHQELESQPVSPVSPELDCGPTGGGFQSLASRIGSQRLNSRPQTRYQQLYEDIIQEVHEQIYPQGRMSESDPFTDPQIHELPATPGLRVRSSVDEEVERIYNRITEVERAMIRERQEARSRELIREGSRYDPRRFSTPATNWI